VESRSTQVVPDIIVIALLLERFQTQVQREVGSETFNKPKFSHNEVKRDIARKTILDMEDSTIHNRQANR